RLSVLIRNENGSRCSRDDTRHPRLPWNLASFASVKGRDDWNRALRESDGTGKAVVCMDEIKCLAADESSDQSCSTEINARVWPRVEGEDVNIDPCRADAVDLLLHKHAEPGFALCWIHVRDNEDFHARNVSSRRVRPFSQIAGGHVGAAQT